MEHYAALNLVDTADGEAFLVFLRIATADEHHTHSRTLVKLYASLVQVTCRNTLKEVNEVALKPQHNALCLRVSHTTVILYDLRLAIDVYQSEEDKALVADVLFCQPINGRLYYAFLYLLHPFLSGERHGSNATHTAGIEACVTLADALVILCLGQYLVVLAVREHKDRALYA